MQSAVAPPALSSAAIHSTAAIHTVPGPHGSSPHSAGILLPAALTRALCVSNCENTYAGGPLALLLQASRLFALSPPPQQFSSGTRLEVRR